ncbi:MAG: glycoside hydrolase family 2 protein, partial [Bacteroidota bacterium]
MKRVIIGLVFFTLTATVFASGSVIQNIEDRELYNLNGNWHYIVDRYDFGFRSFHNKQFDQMDEIPKAAFFVNYKVKNETELIEYDFDLMPTFNVPGDWNSQDEKLFYYEGTVWYKKSFDYDVPRDNKRLFLHFGAANYEAHVYLNGEKLGSHKGGFTPFQFEITGKLKEKDNFIIVRVNNRLEDNDVPSPRTDWWNYGGLTRDINIVETPETFIKDYFIQLDEKDSNIVSGFVQLDGPEKANTKVTVNIDRLKTGHEVKTDNNGKATFNIPVKDVTRWSPQNPFLYETSFATNEDQVKDQIGFRTIQTDESKILLNGKEVFLKGICMHEENPFKRGRSVTEENGRMLLNWAKELGCNFIRLAHYPYNEHFSRMADEMGIMLWEEIPVYWAIEFDNNETFRNASNQLKELISRDKNRASVIIWSVANETPDSKPRQNFLTNLTDTIKAYDNTRLITAALLTNDVEGKENTKTVEDPFAEIVDILSLNNYSGWYGGGEVSDVADIQWIIDSNKPVILSEFGAGALYGKRGTEKTRWSEEYQANVYEQTLKMIDNMPNVSGLSPWILVDFSSPRRNLPNIQDGWNRKGLISDNGQ